MLTQQVKYCCYSHTADEKIEVQLEYPQGHTESK